MLGDVLAVSFLGGLICLDRTCLQLMICRPIVAAPLVGLFLGDPCTGLVAGAFLELFWSDRLPIGTYVPPNDSIVAVVVAAAAILAAGHAGQHARELLALAVLLFIPLGRITERTDTLLIRLNEVLARAALGSAAAGDARGVARRHLLGIGAAFGANVMLICVALAAGVPLLILLDSLLTPALLHALGLMYVMLPLFGVAAALTAVGLDGVIAVFSTACLTAMILLELADVP